MASDNDVLINSKIVYWGLVLIKMWLRLSEKNRKHTSFWATGNTMCVFDGKTWACMLSNSFSHLKLEQTLHALWVINNTKMGQSHPYKYNYIHIIQLSTN